MIALHDVLVENRDGPVHPRALTLGVHPGRVLGVTGTSGVGKSLLLRLLAGEVDPTDGTVTGVPDEVAWIPQSGGLADTLTAVENVAVPLLARSTLGAAAETDALKALAQVGLEESVDHLVEELSGGQQQRVAIARALAHPAPFLFADEPTTALDAGNRRRILHLLQDRARSGDTVVVTTNDPASLEGIADDFLSLDP